MTKTRAGESSSVIAGTATATRTRSFGRRIGRVAVASGLALAVGEAITLVQVVCLARLLTPAEIGLFTAGTVLTAFLGDFVEGGLRAALVQRGEQIEDAAETVFWATLAAGALLSGMALAAAPLVGWVFHTDAAGWVAAASSGSMLLFALTHVPEAMLQREFSVRRRVVVGPAVALTFAVVSVTLAAAGFGVWSMVAGSYASSIVWLICVWLLCDWRPGRGRFSYRIWRELANYGFPLLMGLLGLRCKAMVDVVIVGRILGTAPLGQFRYAQRVAQIPERGIVEVGAIALFPAFARIAGDADRLRAAYVRALRWSMVGAAPLSAVMIAIGEPAVVVVLGDQWRQAGLVVVAMAGLGVGRALCSVNYEVIKGAARTPLINWCTAIEVVGGMLATLILVRAVGLVGAGLALSITACAVGTTLLLFGCSVVGTAVNTALQALAPAIPAAIVAGSVTFYVEHFVFHSDAHSVIAGIGLLTADLAIFGATYIAVLFAAMPTTMRQLVGVAMRIVADRRRPTETTCEGERG